MSVPYYGDFPEDDTVDILFNTFSSDDPSASVTITNFINTDVHIHKDGGLTQRNNAAGITVSVDFDGITGNHLVKIDTSDDTVGGFWVTGSEYQVRIEGATVDGATINVWIGAFSIERAGGVIALLKLIQAAVITNAAGTDIAADIIAVKAETATIVNDTDVIDDGTSGLVKIAQDVAAVLVDTAAQDTTTKIRTLLTGADTPVCKDSTPLTAAEAESECNDALVALNLDHLMKTVTGGADMTSEVPDNTVLSRMMANGDTSAFTPSTDGLQPIRDRGDAAWAGAPESVSGTIAIDTADTIFDLTATGGTLSAQDDTYNNMIVCILDNSGSVFETARITDYDGTNTRITIDHELTFSVEDGVDTFVIYRAAYAPVGAASITEGDMNTIVDKVHDEDVLSAHQTAGTAGYFLRRSGSRF